jgi:hypothetical protein
MALFRKKVSILPEDEFRFKPVLGVRPEVYVTALFALAAALALFCLFFLPGIVNPGSVVAFRSEPSGAAVYVDEVYAGQTPCDVFTAEGERAFSMAMAGFHTQSAAITVKGRLFGSLFAPRREQAAMALEEQSPNAALLEGAREFAAWSFTSEPVEVYQIPLALSEGAYRSGPNMKSEAAQKQAAAILAGAARFAQRKAGMKDLVRALALSGNGGNAPSPLSLPESLRDALAFVQDNPEAITLLADVLPSGARKTALESAWYKAAARAGDGRPAAVSTGRTLTVEEVLFTEVRSDGGAFWAALTPVTDAQYARFTQAQPEWRKENAQTLAGKGLVTEDYLVKVDDRRYPSPVVSGVSWYAAEAYCRWLSERLPESLDGWEAALPAEAQWEDAALAPGIAGTHVIFEWCADPFAPFPSFKTDPEVIRQIGSPERTVRGISWTQSKPADLARALEEGRGSTPPESSSPFTSFRPVLVRTR